MKENHKVIYYNLLTQGKLNSYLHKIDIRAKERYDLLVKLFSESQDITEELKAEKSPTTSSTGGLILALQRAMLLLAPQGDVASTFTGPL